MRRALGTEDPVDLVETILMLSGVKYKVGEYIEIYDCFLPAYGCIPMKSVCEAFLEGVSPKIKIREGIFIFINLYFHKLFLFSIIQPKVLFNNERYNSNCKKNNNEEVK